MKHWIVVAGIVLVVSLIIWFKTGAINPPTTCLYKNTECLEGQTECLAQNTDKNTETICINGIKEGSLVTSPLAVTGRARGNWFFEASFPIELQDQANQLLSQGIAQAQGEWMTEDLVPFTAELTFTAPTTSDSGKLILRKDNPSGLPENDAELSIPIRFK